mmetsp:Transcript_19372/g.43295  ORF Transcript_19372/g.43295 Transcript_19372/m.43295 type:complete len:237 (-) Transcript_19372:272-982(-)
MRLSFPHHPSCFNANTLRSLSLHSSTIWSTHGMETMRRPRVSTVTPSNGCHPTPRGCERAWTRIYVRHSTHTPPPRRIPPLLMINGGKRLKVQRNCRSFASRVRATSLTWCFPTSHRRLSTRSNLRATARTRSRWSRACGLQGSGSMGFLVRLWFTCHTQSPPRRSRGRWVLTDAAWTSCTSCSSRTSSNATSARARPVAAPAGFYDMWDRGVSYCPLCFPSQSARGDELACEREA